MVGLTKAVVGVAPRLGLMGIGCIAQAVREGPLMLSQSMPRINVLIKTFFLVICCC